MDIAGQQPDRLGGYVEYLGPCGPTAAKALQDLSTRSAMERLWARQGNLWSSDPAVIQDVEDRLGWLGLPQVMRAELPLLEGLARSLVKSGIKRAILLGMGGSSLAPEVLSEALGPHACGLELVVLDATDPAQIRRVEQDSDLSRTVFLASSKSGTTAETRTLLEYFGGKLRDIVGERWVDHIIAISDPGTPLIALAREQGFAASLASTPDVGGRYSALTMFGLVPGALIGGDCGRLLESAAAMAQRCGAGIPVSENSACRLGAAMASLALAGRDKLTLITSPSLASFGWWAEQLIAESTGKNGIGILPVEGEPVPPAATYGDDRLFAYVRLAGDDNAASDAHARAVAEQGHPVIVTRLTEPYDLGGEFFRWEMATAIAGVVLGINPFDQPNVEEAKDGAREALAVYERTGKLDETLPQATYGGLTMYGEPSEATDGVSYVRRFLGQTVRGDYVALMAYVDRTAVHAALLQNVRALLGARLGVATTVGFGPRFLHSTGQFHKGGKNSGLFIQITQVDALDLEIPGRGYTFGVLKSAQAAGDMAALKQSGRRVIRIRIGPDVSAGLQAITRLLESALL
jgi:transaldolase/glucose-6-phosphate isomerase